MSLFEDMMKEIEELKAANEELKKEMENNLKVTSYSDEVSVFIQAPLSLPMSPFVIIYTIHSK